MNTSKKEGYELLENEYKNNSTRMRYQCPDHPDKELYIRFSDFKNGQRCPYCYGNVKYTYDQAKSEFTELGYILLDEKYVNGYEKMKFICQIHKNKTQSMPFMKLKQGQRCKFCRIEENSGKNHYKWREDLDDEFRNTDRRYNGEFKKWSLKVKQRDDFRCQCCGKRNDKLESHHINSWDEYKSERFDIENGVTLCSGCHKNFHKDEGFGSNNKHQFKSWMIKRNIMKRKGLI